MTRRTRRRGFTLLEVLVAVAVTGMVLAIVYSAFGRTIESKEYVEIGNETYHKIRWAMDKITMDLASSFVFREQGSNTIFYGVSHLVGSMPMDEIHFTSFSHIRYNPAAHESDQCEISYKVAWIPDDQRFQLWRREDATIDSQNQTGGEELQLLDDVLAFNIRYYDGYEWRDDWDSRPLEQLAEATEESGEGEETEVEQTEEMVQAVPIAVEVTLAVMGPDGAPIVFTSKTKLEMSTIDLDAEDEETGDDAGGSEKTDDDDAGGKGKAPGGSGRTRGGGLTVGAG
ncbi:MAG: prepilin-type N-terminal cleavage/methylation domain-containing protein [Deltaproteobacteria bacterium]|nr:prepilin-type N-terminal cleavage/methylation domain-containing protein [Deltaproteobacteria bacterium]